MQSLRPPHSPDAVKRASVLIGFFAVGCVLPGGPLASNREAPAAPAPTDSPPVGSSENERSPIGPSAQAAPSALPAPAASPAKVVCGPPVSAAPPNGFANDPDLARTRGSGAWGSRR